MKTLLVKLALLFLGLCVQSCLVQEEIDNETMMDGHIIFDPALQDTSYFLISDSLSYPSAREKQTPVVVAAHGFTASTYEWQEFRNFADSCGDFLVSQVLLGGHGRTYEDFKNSTWEDWQAPIMREYEALDRLGFENISIAAASTGGTLVLEWLSSGAFNDLNPPKWIFFIDVIVVPSQKMLTAVDAAGPLLGNSISPGTEEEEKHWYVNRPAEALAELLRIISIARRRLQQGITLPRGTEMKIYKSKKDGSADPAGTLLMYKGIEESGGSHPEVLILDSRKHVFTRGAGRSESWTREDSERQYRTFLEMREKVLE